ncbi:lytic transglycosylase domain-containing protein [Roseomonas sp. CAU 1739]|uniref:lytic transglycosylase domain-containing protein n=1 Tax=Roseomonas sp. CAU 1739 TaxID=3140364 RepID=UPI00325AD9C2
MQKNGPRTSRLPGLILPLAALAALSAASAQANTPQRATEANRPVTTAARPPAGPRQQVAARAVPAPAPPVLSNDPWDACARAIAIADQNSGLPPGLLGAIARVETGRRAPTGGIQPWPWSFNAAGEGRYMASRAEAVAEVQARLAVGTRSVDIGCMQINLLHHPDAFTSVDAGFDPETNVRYAVRYLKSLFARTGDWAAATGQYHSSTPERATIYHLRVTAALTGQGFTPGPAPGVIPLPGPAMAGLCASGRGAVLLVGDQTPSLRPIVAVPSVELRLRGRSAAAPPPARPRIMCLRTSSRAAPG